MTKHIGHFPDIVRPTEPPHRVKQLIKLRSDYIQRKATASPKDAKYLTFRVCILDAIIDEGVANLEKVLAKWRETYPIATLSRMQEEWFIQMAYAIGGGEQYLVTWGRGNLDERYPPETLE